MGLLSAAVGQEANITLQVEGPGVASFGTPRPHLAGQNLELRATAVPGARFLRWIDGVTSANRTIVVTAGNSVFTAVFESLPFEPNPDFSDRALSPLHPNSSAYLDPPWIGTGRVQLSVTLPGRHGYRLFRTKALGQNPLTPEPFATNATGPLIFSEHFGGPGNLLLWVDLPPEQDNGFFVLQLDNVLNLPVLFYADVNQVAPGADVNLVGDNLTGSVNAQAGTTSLSATPLSDERVRVTAPSTPGQMDLTLRVNGVQALGSVPLRVMAPASSPSLDALPTIAVPPGGVMRITGSGFGTNVQVWLDQRLLQVVGRADDGTELYVRLPVGFSGGRLNVVSNGTRSVSRTLTLTPFRYTPGVQPVAAYAFTSNSVHFAYTPGVQPVSAYAFTPNSVHFSYTPGVQPVAAYAFTSNSVHFAYTPGVQPVSAYAFTPNSVHFSYTPGVQPVCVRVP